MIYRARDEIAEGCTGERRRRKETRMVRSGREPGQAMVIAGWYIAERRVCMWTNGAVVEVIGVGCDPFRRVIRGVFVCLCDCLFVRMAAPCACACGAATSSALSARVSMYCDACL